MWTGTINLHVAGRLVGVEYDSEATAAAIRDACRSWLSNDQRAIAAAFGVRTAPVGLRRRRIGVLHHGTAVRQRTPDLATAAEALGAIVAEMAIEPSPQEARLPFRVFRRGARAVLVEVPAATDIDDRPLRKRDIVEVPTWWARIDPERGVVCNGGAMLAVAGVVMVSAPAASTSDDLRRLLWPMVRGDRSGWAALLDRLDDSVIVRTDDPTSEIRRVLT